MEYRITTERLITMRIAANTWEEAKQKAEKDGYVVIRVEEPIGYSPANIYKTKWRRV